MAQTKGREVNSKGSKIKIVFFYCSRHSGIWINMFGVNNTFARTWTTHSAQAIGL